MTQDFEQYHFNKAIARLRELSNALFNLSFEKEDERQILEFGFPILIRLLAPFVPHFSEEMWQLMGHSGESISQVQWPKADLEFVQEDTVTLGIQVNGKLRGEITVSRTLPQETLEKMACSLESVMKHLQGAVPKKVIIIKDRVINVVV